MFIYESIHTHISSGVCCGSQQTPELICVFHSYTIHIQKPELICSYMNRYTHTYQFRRLLWTAAVRIAIFICICLYVRSFICTCIHMYTYVFISIFACMYINAGVCCGSPQCEQPYSYVYVCMCTDSYAYEYICIHMYSYPYLHACI